LLIANCKLKIGGFEVDPSRVRPICTLHFAIGNLPAEASSAGRESRAEDVNRLVGWGKERFAAELVSGLPVLGASSLLEF
jgi:hypothetical protein